MFSIHRYPFFGKRFFKRIRKILGGGLHFQYFWRLVMGIASLSQRKSLSRLTKLFDHRRSRQAINHFLSKVDWDAPGILMENALTMLRKLGWKSGDTLYLVLDDTQKAKRAKKMDAVSKIYLHAEKIYAQGHTILGCAFVYRGVVVPCAVRLWASKDYCLRSQNTETPLEFKKLTQLAAECIESVRLPSPGKMIVMFDRFYLCSEVVNACKNRNFDYIGAVKTNRNFYPDHRPTDKRKIGVYSNNYLERKGTWVNIKEAKKRHRIAECVGTLSKAGHTKLVFSRREGEKSWIILSSSNIRYSAKTILEHYRNRWPIEVLFKMSKQYLGLGDYQFLRYRAVERYLHLVMISYHLLTHLAYERLDEKERARGKEKLRLMGIEKSQVLLRELIFKDVVNSYAEGKKYGNLGKKLERLLVPAD